MFTEEEVACRGSPLLTRLATVATDGQSTVDAIGFQCDGERFHVGGHALARSRTYRDMAVSNRLVALIVDDLASACSAPASISGSRRPCPGAGASSRRPLTGTGLRPTESPGSPADAIPWHGS